MPKEIKPLTDKQKDNLQNGASTEAFVYRYLRDNKKEYSIKELAFNLDIPEENIRVALYTLSQKKIVTVTPIKYKLSNATN